MLYYISTTFLSIYMQSLPVIFTNYLDNFVKMSFTKLLTTFLTHFRSYIPPPCMTNFLIIQLR